MKDINKLAIESIKSSTVREYLKDIKHEFNIQEQISLIFNSDLSLDSKTEIFEDLVNSDNVAESIKDEVREIIKNFEAFKIVAYEYNNIAFITFDEDNEVICTNALDKLRDYNIKNKLDKNIRAINIGLDDVESNTLYEIELNSDGEVCRIFPYELAQYKTTNIENSYVDIPNEFKMGDIVRVVGQKEKYVVVSDSDMPEHLKPSCDFIDTSITVVPKRIFNSSTRSYKDQIEDIYRNRIKHIEYSEPIIDIISREHQHLKLTVVEKV